MMDTKLTHEISVKCDKPVLLPLTSLKYDKTQQAFLDHEYCPETFRHLRLRCYLQKPII